MEQEINLSNWNRREIFDFFSQMSNPFYMVTFRLDVTRLYAYVKAHSLSFYYTLIYLCTQAINETDAFRCLIRRGQVFQFDRRSPSFTDLRKGSDCFHIVTMPCDGDIFAFNQAAKARSQAQTHFLDTSGESDQLICFSCLPWVDLTAVTNARDMSAPGNLDDSNPHITWGKYVRTGDRLELGLSIEVSHRLIDGVHIGQFAQRLEQLIRSLPETAL